MSRVPLPGFGRDEQAVAWLRALLRGVRSGDARMVALAQAELRALGIEVRPLAPGGKP